MVHLAAVESIWTCTPKVGGKDELKEEKENLSNREKKMVLVLVLILFNFLFWGRGEGVFWHGTITHNCKEIFIEAVSSRYLIKQTCLGYFCLNDYHVWAIPAYKLPEPVPERTNIWMTQCGPLLQEIYLKVFLLMFVLIFLNANRKLLVRIILNLYHT